MSAELLNVAHFGCIPSPSPQRCYAARRRALRSLSLLAIFLLAGCSSSRNSDARLDGTWRYAGPWLGRECTVTFSNGLEVDYHTADTNNLPYRSVSGLLIRTGDARTDSFRYRIVRRQPDYVDIRRWGYVQIVDFVSTTSAQPPVGKQAKLIQAPPDDLRVYFGSDDQSFCYGSKKSGLMFVRRDGGPESVPDRR
jgi:hypothetical protein